MTSTADNPITLAKIAKGLADNQFHYYCQPIVSLEKGAVVGAECLLRWQSADGNVLAPSAFIPIAEETGFMAEMGAELYRHVADTLQLISAIDEDIYLTLNISEAELASSGLAQRLEAELNMGADNRDKLRLEITERVMFPASRVVKQGINELAEQGFLLMLDDFGAGNSSANYLSDLSLIGIKLSKSMIQAVSEHAFDFKVFRHMVGLAHQLELGIVAEGIENTEMLDLIKSTGCNDVQGFYFARPLPLEKFLDFLRTKPSWDSYSFGSEYLIQIDHIDYRRDIIRESLIFHNSADPQIRARALKRMPLPNPHLCLFGKWLDAKARVNNDSDQEYQLLVDAHMAFHARCAQLVEGIQAGMSTKDVKDLIVRLSELSDTVMSLTQKISFDSMNAHFIG